MEAEAVGNLALSYGISIVGITFFIDKFVQNNSLRSCFTSDMLQIVKDATKTSSGGKSFCEKLLETNETNELVGLATVFISHAWKYEFETFVNALKTRFEKEPEAYLWIDIFSHNQHNELSSDEWITNFEEHIKRINRTVMIAMPWHNPIPFTR